jgi:hypothetical protein
MGASALWIRKLTHWLPYHRDRYFENLAAAVHGAYHPQFSDDGKPASEPSSAVAEADFERRMADMHRKAEPLLRKLRPNKRGR